MPDAELKAKVEELYAFMESLKANTTIPLDVAEAFRLRLGADIPEGLANAPVTVVANPTGGTTIDTESRSAIAGLKSALQTLGLMES